MRACTFKQGAKTCASKFGQQQGGGQISKLHKNAPFFTLNKVINFDVGTFRIHLKAQRHVLFPFVIFILFKHVLLRLGSSWFEPYFKQKCILEINGINHEV